LSLLKHWFESGVEFFFVFRCHSVTAATERHQVLSKNLMLSSTQGFDGLRPNGQQTCNAINSIAASAGSAWSEGLKPFKKAIRKPIHHPQTREFVTKTAQQIHYRFKRPFPTLESQQDGATPAMQTTSTDTREPEAALPLPAVNMISDSFDAGSDLLGLLVDELAHGVMIVSAQGWILHANRAALGALKRGVGLATTHGGLKLKSAADQSRLALALARAAGGKRSLIRLDDAGGSTNLAVVPLNRQSTGPCDRIALMFSREDACEPSLFAYFAQSHRLTRTEEQVLQLLCRCLSAPEIAIQMKVAVSTIRSHVRSLCAKTATHGVRQLINLVAALPPLAPAQSAAKHMH
jgi:DNA-binding CsgD family transcriptional regulator